MDDLLPNTMLTNFTFHYHLDIEAEVAALDLAYQFPGGPKYDAFDVVLRVAHIHPCRLVGDFITFVEAGDIVDTGRLKVNTAMLSCVDMSAKDKARTLLDDGLSQLRRAEMLGVRL